MSLKLFQSASLPVVTLAETKQHLRVDVTDDDALITLMITAATLLCEQKTGRALLTQQWDLALDSFPDAFVLTRTPVAAVVSISYSDATGALQTLPSNQYSLDVSDSFGPAFIVPAYGATWPETRDQINAVTVRYTAGWVNAAAVPENLKSWVKLMVGSMYANRESEQGAASNASSKLLEFADSLLDSDRTVVL